MTSVELTKKCLSQISENRDLNAFVTVCSEEALESAHKSDVRRYKRSALGKLEGIPISVKDAFCTSGVRTTAASKMLSDFIPPYDAHVCSLLRRSGAIIVGKTNMDEFSMGSSTSHSSHGPCVSPWSRYWLGSPEKISPGGSSGGSAVAVSTGMSYGALGSDTGGSVRQPGAFCGVVGLKPSYGRISRWGLIAFASSLDVPSLMARKVEDVAIMLEVLSQYDPRDATCVDFPVTEYFSEVQQTSPEFSKKLVVGVPDEYNLVELSKDHRDAWRRSVASLESLGATVKQVSLPHTKYALPAYYILSSAEASSNLNRYDGIKYGGVPLQEFEKMEVEDLLRLTRDEGFGMEVKRRLLIGTFVLSRTSFDSYYLQATKVRRLVRDDFTRVFQEDGVDVLVTPTAPSSSFSLEKPMDPIEEYLNDVMTIPSSLAGIPAVSVPFELDSKGLPVGIQLIGPYMQESKLLKAAKLLQESSPFHVKKSLNKIILHKNLH